MKLKDNMFKDRVFMSSLGRLALPLALQSLLLASVAAADAFMLGVVDQNSMSAVSLASQVQFVQNIILSAVVSAMTVLCAQYWGRDDRESVSRIFFMALAAAVVTSFVFFVGCVFFPRSLMRLFSSDADIMAIGCRYLEIAGWSYLITGFTQCFLALFKVSDRPRIAMRVSFFAVLCNVVLNWVFIFGRLGAPAMGAYGAAVATLVSRVAELVLCLVLLGSGRGFVPKLSLAFSFKRYLTVDFTKCLLPLVGAGLFWGVGFTSYSAFMGQLGPDSAAANSITAVIRELLSCMCFGLANGGGILIGNCLGSGDLEKGKLYGNRILRLSYMEGFLCTFLMILLIKPIGAVIRLSDTAFDYYVQMMWIMSVYMIGRCVNSVVINGVFAAGGDTLFDMYSLAVVMWCVAVPLAALGTLVFHWPVPVVYACTCLDEVGKIPWVMYHHRKYKWVRNMTRSC